MSITPLPTSPSDVFQNFQVGSRVPSRSEYERTQLVALPYLTGKSAAYARSANNAVRLIRAGVLDRALIFANSICDERGMLDIEGNIHVLGAISLHLAMEQEFAQAQEVIDRMPDSAAYYDLKLSYLMFLQECLKDAQKLKEAEQVLDRVESALNSEMFAQGGHEHYKTLIQEKRFQLFLHTNSLSAPDMTGTWSMP